MVKATKASQRPKKKSGRLSGWEKSKKRKPGVLGSKEGGADNQDGLPVNRRVGKKSPKTDGSVSHKNTTHDKTAPFRKPATPKEKHGVKRPLKTPSLPAEELEGLTESAKRRRIKRERTKYRKEDFEFTEKLNKMYGNFISIIGQDSAKSRELGCGILAAIADYDPSGGKTPSTYNETHSSPAKISFSLVQLGERIKSMGTKSSVSRCLQQILKNGTPEQKKMITEASKPHFLDLASYAKSSRLCQKLLLYCDKETFSVYVAKLLESRGRDLFFTRFGSQVWEWAFESNKIGNARQRLMLNTLLIPKLIQLQHPNWKDLNYQRFYTTVSAEVQTVLHENLDKVITRCVDKEMLNNSLVHRILKSAVQLAYRALPETAALVPESLAKGEEKVETNGEGDKKKDSSEAQRMALSDLMDRVAEGALSLFTTKDGVEAFIHLSGHATSKHKKKIVKAIRPQVVDYACNSVTCLVVMRLLLILDDTKAAALHILKGLGQAIDKVLDSRWGALVVQLIIFNCELTSKRFTPYQLQLLSLPTYHSLKAPEKRAAELLAEFEKALVGTDVANLRNGFELMNSKKLEHE